MTLREGLTDEQMRDQLRALLNSLDAHIDELTPLYFTDADKKTIREQIAIWRFYMSHTFFPPKQKALNTPKTKPPMQYLYNLAITGRTFADLIALCAAPLVKDSSDLRYGADVLKMKLSRILCYAEPEPVPKTFYLPYDHPDKTDQQGIPWAKSQSKGAKKWRKKKEMEAKAKEALKPKAPQVMSEAEREQRTAAYLAEKNRQRELYRKRAQEAIDEANRRHELAEREEAKRRLRRSGG